MKWSKIIVTSLALWAAAVSSLRAQFDSGSTGTVALVVNSGTTLTTNLPPDGKLHFTTIIVKSNATLRFGKNALNTPVYLLAKGDVVIDGTIDVSGHNAGTNTYVGGDPGPGGFAGGAPGYLQQAAGTNFTAPGGSGLGPGGGKPGTSGPTQSGNAVANGRGSYAYGAPNPNDGSPYGYSHLIPLVGGPNQRDWQNPRQRW